MKKYDYLDISSFVEELMEKKESAEIEFKSAAGGFPKAFGKLTHHLLIRMAELLCLV